MKRSANVCGVAFSRGLSLALCFAALLFAGGGHALAQSVARRHVRQQVSSGEAPWLNRLPAFQSLHLDIALPLRNEPELDDLLQGLYDPQSPFFHQFLSVQQFADRFAPTPADYAEVIRFAEKNGLTVTRTSPNRLLVNVTGTVANIERAFHLTLSSYRHPWEARTFFSPDREPSPDLPVALWYIGGLDNFSTPHPASLKREASAIPKVGGSGPSGYFLGSDMRAAYYGGTALTGAGQSVGLVEFAGYNIADVQAYFTKVGQPLNVAVNGISTDGSSLSCTGKCDDTEQVLDIEEVISMAPGLSQVRVYVSDTSDLSMLNKMATENIAKSLSCSWGWSPADPASDDPVFKEFAAQGQNLFVSSGDGGAYTSRSTDVYPADDAYITSVGGTNLSTSSAGGSWAWETAWSGSGGGISVNNIAIPSYQKAMGVITTANKGSTTLRNVPDVAAEANTDNYICYNGTCTGGWGGTSFAAPRWAGYLALANQQLAARGLPPHGFINPSLYSIGLGTTYSANFHDITLGTDGAYTAGKGYDLVTGWGSPNGASLINSSADVNTQGPYLVSPH